MPLALARRAATPTSSSAHLGTVVDASATPFTARNDAHWTDGAFVYVPRDVAGRGADRRSTAIHDAGRHARCTGAR